MTRGTLEGQFGLLQLQSRSAYEYAEALEARISDILCGQAFDLGQRISDRYYEYISQLVDIAESLGLDP